MAVAQTEDEPLPPRPPDVTIIPHKSSAKPVMGRILTGSNSQSGRNTTTLLAAVSSGICIVSFDAVSSDGTEVSERGTAFLINRTGLFLTAKHVVPPGNYEDESLTIDCPYAKYDPLVRHGIGPLPAQKVRYAPNSDLRLLRVDELPSHIYPLALVQADPRVGTSLKIVGYYPKDGRPAPLVREMVVEQNDYTSTFKTSGSVLRGMSGAPLLNEDGGVVGVYVARRDLDEAGAPLIGEAVTASEISDFIADDYEYVNQPLKWKNGVAQDQNAIDRRNRVIEGCRAGTVSGQSCRISDYNIAIDGVCNDGLHDYWFPC